MITRKSDSTVENVTFYFAPNKNEENLTKLISDPLFKKVIAYLFQHKEHEVILRQIKAEISTDSNLELYLDKLIKYNLIQRKNRRYTIKFPIYSNRTDIPVSNSIIEVLQPIIQKDDPITNFFIFGEWLWPLLFEKEQGDYFFGVKHSPETNSDFFKKVEAGNDKMHFISIFPNNRIPLDLANYFNLLSKRQELPKQFEQLQNLIGDVDINYFIPQLQKVIRSVTRNKIRDSKKSIFQEALFVTEDIKTNEENQLFLNRSILNDYNPSEMLNKSLEYIEGQLIPLWANIEDDNQRVFFKKQLYAILFHNCLVKKEYISYWKC